MPNRRALIVAPLYDGVWLPPLAGTTHLVERLSLCLKEKGRYDVKVLTGIVDEAAFRQALDELFDTDGEVLFYFYGHGCLRKTGQGVFAVSGARPYVEGVQMSEVSDLASSPTSRPSEVVLIFDCCHAGAASPVSSAAMAGLSNQVKATAGRVLLAACAAHQHGWETERDDYRKLGAFSGHVLEGLEGGVARKYQQSTVRASLLGTYVTEVFRAWNQDPIVVTSESGSRHCDITSGFQLATGVRASLSRMVSKVGGGSLIIGAPFRPSELFVGRTAELEYLRTLLLDGTRPVAVSATVEGLGGIGKTELVLHLIHDRQIQARFRTIVWLDGAGPIPSQWSKIATELGIQSTFHEHEALIGAIGYELRHRGNALIVLDNASEWGPVASLIPAEFPLLVTTRTWDFGGSGFIHSELGVLSDESARILLMEMVPDLRDDPGTARLIELLGGHALALELAGLNIRYEGIGAAEYIYRVERKVADSPYAVAATKYGRTVDACLSLTWEALKQECSRDLWRIASLFAPTSAHRDLLRVSFLNAIVSEDEFENYYLRTAGENPSVLRRLKKRQPTEFDIAYAELRALHVLSRVQGHGGQRWAMHRLVRDFGRARLQPIDVELHSVALSTWLLRPTLDIADELPHLIAVVLDGARYLTATEGGRRYYPRELVLRSLSETLGWETERRSRRRFLRYREVGILDAENLLRFVGEQMQDPKALILILQALTDINEDVRFQAVKLLESVGPIPEVLEGLVACLSDPDPEVRSQAVYALSKYGEDSTVQILGEVIATSELQARLEAVRALGKMGDKGRLTLETALESSGQVVRIEAAIALCEQRCGSGVEILYQAMQGASEQDQLRYIDALGSSKDARAVPALQKGALVRERRVRLSAIRALAALGDADGARSLFELLRDRDDAVRSAAAGGLIAYGSVDLLIAGVGIAKGPEAERLLETLERTADPKSIDLFRSLLSKPEFRFRAARTLARLGETDAHPVLLDLLQSSHGPDQYEIAEEIVTLGIPDGDQEVLAAVHKLPNNMRREYPKLAKLLAAAPGQPVASSLPAAPMGQIAPISVGADHPLSSDNWKRRFDYVMELRNARNSEAIPTLVEVLRHDTNFGVRSAAAQALGALGDARAIPELVKCAESDPEPAVRRRAQDALKQLGAGESNG